MLKFLKIGNYEIDKTAALAPMASIADKAYRYICKQFGACYMVGELTSAKGLYYSDKKTCELLSTTEFENPMAVQLFGDDPYFMALACEKAVEYGAKIIDVNMGCPVPKVVGNKCGSFLMKIPDLAGKIVKEMVNAVDVPITVKIRKGWDEDSVNAVELAKIIEANGASAITVHGRTRDQMYKPYVDLSIIKSVKESVSIPVIGNGDIIDVGSAVEMYEKTGCDLVMIGRGSYGNPWIFSQIREYLNTGQILKEPSFIERMQVMQKHISLICEFKGEYIGMKEARKQVAFYLKGIPNAAKYRNMCGNLSSYEDFLKLKDAIISSN